MSGGGLEDRFRAHARELGLDRGGIHLLVALSGGCDSTALLRLLHEWAPEVGMTITAAHLDHAMRADSAADAAWVAATCASWGIHLASERLETPPRGESAARSARREFLLRTRIRLGADLVATGHQADDQAETVLFRVLRGTGPRGLAGILPRTPDGFVRPLLPFWREEIRAYARGKGMEWREDPANRDLAPRRNRLRHDLLPRLEGEVAPGARHSLVRLAGIMRRERAERERHEAEETHGVTHPVPGGLRIARDSLRRYDPARRIRIARGIVRRLGVILDHAGTRAAVQFITDAPSGRELHLPDGVRLRSELDGVLVVRDEVRGEERPFVLEGAPEGDPVEGTARIGGRRWRVRCRTARPEEARPGELVVPLGGVAFPLQLRGWRPGDRIRTSAGTKKLKKVFLEHRVPARIRHTLPVVVGGEGTVHAVVGLAMAQPPGPGAGSGVLLIRVSE